MVGGGGGRWRQREARGLGRGRVGHAGSGEHGRHGGVHGRWEQRGREALPAHRVGLSLVLSLPAATRASTGRAPGDAEGTLRSEHLQPEPARALFPDTHRANSIHLEEASKKRWNGLGRRLLISIYYLNNVHLEQNCNNEKAKVNRRCMHYRPFFYAVVRRFRHFHSKCPRILFLSRDMLNQGSRYRSLQNIWVE